MSAARIEPSGRHFARGGGGGRAKGSGGHFGGGGGGGGKFSTCMPLVSV